MLYGNGCIAVAYIIERRSNEREEARYSVHVRLAIRDASSRIRREHTKDTYARRSIFRRQPGIIIVL